MNPFRAFKFFALVPRRRRCRRAPEWQEKFEQIPTARPRTTRRVFVAWSGTQMLPMAVTIEEPEFHRDGLKR